MRLEFWKALDARLEKLENRIVDIREKVSWKIMRLTPKEPNPHKKGTVEFYLHQVGERLPEEFKLHPSNHFAWTNLFSSDYEHTRSEQAPRPGKHMEW
jgi:hypothetical protein